MPEYLSPGAYVEEEDAGPKPIEGVSTSTTAAVGVTERGPSGAMVPGDTVNRAKPVLVTSFADFTRTFGGFLPEPAPNLVNRWALDSSEGGRWWLFPLSVKGFFDNGGQRLYVKRVFAGGLPGGQHASAASAPLGTGVITELARDAGATDTWLRLTHLFGIQNNTQITIVAGGTAIAPAAPFKVTSYDAGTGRVNLNQNIGQELKSGRDFVVVIARNPPAAAAPAKPATPGTPATPGSPAVPPPPATPATPNTRTLTFVAKSVGDWGGNSNGPNPLDGVQVRVRPMVGGTFRILGDPAAGGNAQRTVLTADAAPPAATITVASIAGFANGDHILILGREYIITAAT